MKTINLDKILQNHMDFQELIGGHGLRVKAAMMDFSKQLFELAAENAKGKVLSMNETGVIRYSEIDKQSILDTINQVV